MITNLNELSKCKGHVSVVWNARSILNKIEEVDRIATTAKPSFIGSTESWLNDAIDDALVRIAGYNIHRFNRTQDSGKKTGGGVIWYYNAKLNCTPLPNLNYCDQNVELCVLRLNLTRTRAIYMVLIYRSPTGNITEFLSKLEVLTTELRNIGLCEINLTGDFNLDLLKNDTRIRQYKETMKRLGFTNVINEVTHIKQQELGFSLLDHYQTTDSELYGFAGALATNASDHFFVYTAHKKPKIKHRKSRFKGRAYSRLDENQFKEDISNVNWQPIIEEQDSNTAWELFRLKFIEILHSHAPQKTFNTCRDKQPWVTTSYLESANERDDLQHKAKKTQSALDDLRTKIVRNRTVSLKRNLKALYFQTSIQEAGSDSAKLWKALKRLLENSKPNNNITMINDKNDPLEIVEELNNFFATIGTNLAQDIPPFNLELNFDQRPNIPLLELEHTNINEVTKLLMAISDAKATGEDEIPVRFIKMCIDSVAPIITYIINLSIETKTAPIKWKTAVITPFVQGRG